MVLHSNNQKPITPTVGYNYGSPTNIIYSQPVQPIGFDPYGFGGFF
jgi:hypothetical protein